MATKREGQSPALQFKQVHFSYGHNNHEKEVLKEVNFTVKHGEFVSIVGASGTGKSTIFRLAVGLEQPSRGDIFLNNEKVKHRLGKVGYMPQQDLLMPWRTIKENAMLPLEIKGKNGMNDELVLHLLKEFGLQGYENKYPHELSGGMKQRVSFLRASLSGSNLLLLDEPFSALDAMTKLFMQEWLLAQWENQQSTILFITHDISEALFLSDRIFIMTETPVTSLEELIVPLVRPRKQTDLDQPAVLELKNNLIDRFRMRV